MLPKTSGWAENGLGCFEITSIDTNASIIQADYKARGDSETNNYTFSVDAGTRIVLKNGDVFSKTNLSALSVGNKLVIEFPIDEKVEPRPHLLVSGGTSENESDYYTDLDNQLHHPKCKQMRMEILDRWAATNAAGRLYTFVIDDSVWLWKNGICESDFNDLQIGDQVTVGYEEWYEIQHQGQVDIYPDMLLASHPLGTATESDTDGDGLPDT